MLCCIVRCRNDSGDHSDHMHYYQVGFSSGECSVEILQWLEEWSWILSSRWVNNGYQKLLNFNLPFCDRVKNIFEIEGEVAEIQTGLQIQIDKDNSVSDLRVISATLFGLTTHWNLCGHRVKRCCWLGGCLFRESATCRFCACLVGQPHSPAGLGESPPSKGFIGQGLTLALVLSPLASSDCYIYDSATGYYYDPLAETYYDPNTQVSFWLCLPCQWFFCEENLYFVTLNISSPGFTGCSYMKSGNLWNWIFLPSRQLLWLSVLHV